MRRQQEGSTQARTFEAIKAAGEITIRGLQEALGLPGSKGYARISHATQDLVRAGYIKRTSPATYTNGQDCPYPYKAARSIHGPHTFGTVGVQPGLGKTVYFFSS